MAVRKPTYILIVGDFNSKEINWTNNITETSKTSIQSLLLDKITTLGWFQHVKSFTRFKTTYIIRTSKKEYERKIAKGMKANPKYLEYGKRKNKG